MVLPAAIGKCIVRAVSDDDVRHGVDALFGA